MTSLEWEFSLRRLLLLAVSGARSCYPSIASRCGYTQTSGAHRSPWMNVADLGTVFGTPW